MRVEQHDDLARRRHLARHDQSELVQQALWVLHHADHPAGYAGEVSVSPMLRCSAVATPLVTATWPGPAG